MVEHALLRVKSSEGLLDPRLQAVSDRGSNLLEVAGFAAGFGFAPGLLPDAGLVVGFGLDAGVVAVGVGDGAAKLLRELNAIAAGNVKQVSKKTVVLLLNIILVY